MAIDFTAFSRSYHLSSPLNEEAAKMAKTLIWTDRETGKRS